MAGYTLFDPNYNAAQNAAFYGGNTNWMTNPSQGLAFGANTYGASAPAIGTAGLGAGGGQGFNWQGLGQGINTGIGALSTIGNIWGAFQSNKLARQQFDFTKGVTNTNLNNQIQSYNTQLEDRARTRAAIEGTDPKETQDWIDRNRLTRSGG